MLDYLKNYYKTIAIDLSKQQALDAYPKVIQQITGDVDWAEQRAMYFITEEVNDYFRFFARNSKSIAVLFSFNIISVLNGSIKYF